MSIREQAARLGVEIVGELTRREDWERATVERCYQDATGTRFFTRRGILTIILPDGGIV
jgi:hypothetical protein